MLVRHHLEIKGIELHSELLNGNCRIVADAGQLQQALVALLVNALEAMSGLDSGKGKLTLRLRGSDDEVQIDVGDTGAGIPAEVLPQIFEPFFSTKETERGVGLGLAVVYGIVQRHGGRIEVESQIGQGTVFHLRLPRQARSRTMAGRPMRTGGGRSHDRSSARRPEVKTPWPPNLPGS